MKLIIDIHVSDLQRAVTFYTGALGLPCRVYETDWAAITVGDAEIHLYVDGGVTHGVEFYVDDIENKVRALAKQGVQFISGIDKSKAIRVDEKKITEFPWGKIAYFHDSEGNEMALVEDF